MRALRRTLTTRGVSVAGCGAVLVAAGMLLGQVDLSRVGVLLLALVAAALLLVRRHGLGLEVSRTLAPVRVAVDERCLVTLALRNTEPRRTPLLMVEEGVDDALGDRPRFLVPSLPAGAGTEVQYPLASGVRGVHRVGPLVLRVSDPFGLARRTAALSGQAEVVALPRVVPLAAARCLGSGIGTEGALPHMVALHGEDDQTVREYRDGDDLRRIHWPATARTGDLMVRQEDRPAKRRAVVLLDSRDAGHAGSGPTGSLEWCVTTAASVTAHLAGAGYAVHMLTADPGAERGTRHDGGLEGALDALARVGPGAEDAIRAVLHDAVARTAQGGLVVYTGGPLGDEDTHALAALRQGGSSGVALVVEPRSFGGRGGRGAVPARATCAVLRASGWLATPVESGTEPAQAWSAVVGGPLAAVPR